MLIINFEVKVVTITHFAAFCLCVFRHMSNKHCFLLLVNLCFIIFCKITENGENVSLYVIVTHATLCFCVSFQRLLRAALSEREKLTSTDKYIERI